MMNLWTQVDSNKRKSLLFVALFIILVIGLGWLFSVAYNSLAILVIAIVIALVQSFLSFFGGDSLVLSMSGAREIAKSDAPQLWNAVENISITAGLPMPKVYLIEDEAPNAFATGRDPQHASIAVTTGLMKTLTKTELEGVVAHEMSHIGNFDIRLMMVITILVSVVALLSNIFIRTRFIGRRDNEGGGILIVFALIAAILSPLIATIVQLAISRKREFLADADGALLTRYPEGLASALEKISKYDLPVERVNPSTSHLYIANPLGGEENKKQSFFSKLFSTHPPAEERIKILRGLEK
jgi:heat shock protein HtpX